MLLYKKLLLMTFGTTLVFLLFFPYFFVYRLYDLKGLSSTLFRPGMSKSLVLAGYSECTLIRSKIHRPEIF